MRRGGERGGGRGTVIEAEKIKLNGNYLYHSLLGELYTGTSQKLQRIKLIRQLKKKLLIGKYIYLCR